MSYVQYAQIREPGFINNIENGRYAVRVVNIKKAQSSASTQHIINLKMGNYIFSAYRGGPLNILKISDENSLQRVCVLSGFSCESLQRQNDRVQVVSRGVLYELDFESEAATKHFSDTCLGGYILKLFW